MRAKLVRIGNSKGVRIPKPVLEEAGLGDEVEIRVKSGEVVISAVRNPRAGWAEAIAKLGPPELLDGPTPTRFDDEEWTLE